MRIKGILIFRLRAVCALPLRTHAPPHPPPDCRLSHRVLLSSQLTLLIPYGYLDDVVFLQRPLWAKKPRIPDTEACPPPRGAPTPGWIRCYSTTHLFIVIGAHVRNFALVGKETGGELLCTVIEPSTDVIRGRGIKKSNPWCLFFYRWIL